MQRPLKPNITLSSAPSACFLLFLSLLLVISLILLSSFCLLSSFDTHKAVDPQLIVRKAASAGKLHAGRSWDDGAMALKRLASTADRSSYDVNCDGRRIYMYPLPEEFNAWILQQCHGKIAPWLKFCPHFLNHGFGRPANITTSAAWADWYETDPYMLEVIFHSRMPYYPCITQLPAQADAFFIPYYTGLDALHYLYGERKRQRGEHGRKLLRWLQQNEGGKYWRRRGGHDHFIVVGRTAWDLSWRRPQSRLARPQGGHVSVDGQADDDEGSWGTSFAILPEMGNVTALFVERRPWQALEQAIPYPTGFHPTSLQSLRAWQHKVQTANRTFLMAFVGAPRPLESCYSEVHRNIRQAAIDQCAGNRTACSLLDCSKLKCAHESVQIAEHLLHAHFCLQPPGDSTTRRSTFDGLLSGCIPVFFMNDSAYNQYTWHLPGLRPSSYSVFVPGHHLHRVLPLLSSFSAKRIANMRRFIVKHLITQIIYAGPQLAASQPSLRDAFQISLDHMLRRVNIHPHPQNTTTII